MNDCCYNPPTHIFQKGWSVQIIASWYMENFPHTMYTFRFKGYSYDIAEKIVSVPLAKAEESGWGSSNNIAAVNAVDTPTHFPQYFAQFFSQPGSGQVIEGGVKVNTWGREGAWICMVLLWVVWQMQPLGCNNLVHVYFCVIVFWVFAFLCIFEFVYIFKW